MQQNLKDFAQLWRVLTIFCKPTCHARNFFCLALFLLSVYTSKENHSFNKKPVTWSYLPETIGGTIQECLFPQSHCLFVQSYVGISVELHFLGHLPGHCVRTDSHFEASACISSKPKLAIVPESTNGPILCSATATSHRSIQAV